MISRTRSATATSGAGAGRSRAARATARAWRPGSASCCNGRTGRCRLGDVEVGVQQDLQGLAQVGGLRRVLRERAEHVAHERAQLAVRLRTVRDERDQPVQAELVEERRRPAPGAPGGRPPPRGAPGRRPRQPVQGRATRLAPTENGRRPPPLSPATAVTTRRTTSWPATGSASPSSTGRRDHLGGEVDGRDAGRDALADLAPGGQTAPATADDAGPTRARRSGRSRPTRRRPAGPGPSRTWRRARRRTPGPRCATSSRSRRKSPWYLFSTAVTASSRVISSAATVAAPLQGVDVVGPSGPSVPQADEPCEGRRPSAATRSHAGLPRPMGARPRDPLDPQPTGGSTRPASASTRPGRVGQGRRALAAVGGGDDHAHAEHPRPRPRSGRGCRPRSTICVNAVCSASTRASAALASSSRSPVISCCAPRPSRWHNLTSANRNRPR